MDFETGLGSVGFGSGGGRVFGDSATSRAGVKRHPVKKGIRNPMRGTAKKMIFFYILQTLKKIQIFVK